MAQFYTLDEAAARLGIPTDEFKRKTKTEWTSLRPFRDGATLRYRAADIDELARSLGAASDPGLALGAPGAVLSDSSEEMALHDSPIDFGPDSGSKLGDDIFTLSTGDSGKMKGGKPPGDSDVRLDLSPKSGSLGRKPTGDVTLDPPKPASSAKLTAPKSGSKLSGGASNKVPSAPPADSDSSSEFELRLDADSDSFELPGDGDAVDLAVSPKKGKGPQSGINLARPGDSGVSLEKQAADDPSSDMDFELSLDAPASGNLAPRTGPIRRDPALDSSSEFELTLDDSSGSAESFIAGAEEEAQGQGDIFETDFDLPAVDESGSEAVAVDADTDLDGGFEVDVASDEADAVLTADDEAVELEEEEPTAGRALRGVSRDDDDDLAPAGVRTVVAAPPAWGPLPAAVLLPSMIVLFLGSIMSYESLRGMWGYHQPSKPASALVRGVAETVAGKVAD